MVAVSLGTDGFGKVAGPSLVPASGLDRQDPSGGCSLLVFLCRRRDVPYLCSRRSPLGGILGLRGHRARGPLSLAFAPRAGGGGGPPEAPRRGWVICVPRQRRLTCVGIITVGFGGSVFPTEGPRCQDEACKYQTAVFSGEEFNEE